MAERKRRAPERTDERVFLFENADATNLPEERKCVGDVTHELCRFQIAAVDVHRIVKLLAPGRFRHAQPIDVDLDQRGHSIGETFVF